MTTDHQQEAPPPPPPPPLPLPLGGGGGGGGPSTKHLPPSSRKTTILDSNHPSLIPPPSSSSTSRTTTPSSNTSTTITHPPLPASSSIIPPHHSLNILPLSSHSFNQHAHSIASLIRQKRKLIAARPPTPNLISSSSSSSSSSSTSTRTLPPPPLQLLLDPNPSTHYHPHTHQSLPSTPSTSTLNPSSLEPPSIDSSNFNPSARRFSTKSTHRTRTNTRIISHHNLSDLMIINPSLDTLKSSSSPIHHHHHHHHHPLNSKPLTQKPTPPSLINLLPKSYHPLDALDPALGEVVMTPTTEEWWAFGRINHRTPKFTIKPDDSNHPTSTAQLEAHLQDDQIDQEDVDEVDDDSDHTGASTNESDSSPNQSPKPQPSSSITTPDHPLEPCSIDPSSSSPPTSRLTPINVLCSASSISPNPLSNSPSSLLSPLQSSSLELSTGLISIEAEPSLALTSVNGIINVPSNSLVHPQPIRSPPLTSPPILTASSSNSFGSPQHPNPSLTSSALLSSLLEKVPPSSLPRPCGLIHDGIVRKPIDPRSYSAITHHRHLESFVIHSAAGSGAYGIVKHAQEKGTDGQPVGPPLVIKYIIKQRILADCWKRHKVLGPIPIEIHVLDHLRRVNSRPSIISMAKTYDRTRRSKGELDPIRIIPNRAELIETYTQEEGVDRVLQTSTQQRTGHPNICGILDYFEDVDYYYLVMPRFGDGKDLFEHIEMSPDGLPIDQVRKIFGQIVDAVAYLHERNIVHRDLKDENVILDRDGNAQLIDFGSAAYVREGSKFETFSGTLDFAAPEVLKGVPHSGKEIDVWALGVILYVLMTGECPFWNPEEAAKGMHEGTRARERLEERLSAIRTTASQGQGSDPESDQDYQSILDLLLNCLRLEPHSRPSVELICWHQFFLGRGGWSTNESKEFPSFSDPSCSST